MDDRWTILYPIYLDAKRPKKTGQRRVGKEHAVEWPLAREMAQAAASLGFKVHLEVSHGSSPVVWSTVEEVLCAHRITRGILQIGRIQVGFEYCLRTVKANPSILEFLIVRV